MINRIVALLVMFLLLLPQLASADKKDTKVSSKNDDKLLLKPVTDNVYAIVGPLGNRSKANLGNNATFGFIVTPDGVVLVDPGGTYLGAKRIHQVIQSVTKSPIKFVVNTGGQDHRWLGNDYFKKRGAKVIASKNAVNDQQARLRDILFRLSNSAGDKAIEGTVESYADIQFDDQYKFALGGISVEVYHPGAAHSPGDSFVWLPQQKVVFSGDIIYMKRMLSVMSFSNSQSWIRAFEAIEAMDPAYIIPGHGDPTTMADAKNSTLLYLTTLRSKVEAFMDAGGIIQDVSNIDQSQFSYLENYDSLKGRNVQQVYQEMEWE